MTSSTLCYIWDSVLEAPPYLGRFDWPGVKFRDMKIKRYVFLREFFRHHDSYGHVTGMRLFSDAHESKSAVIELPDVTNLGRQVDFHYQRWLDSYALFLRNSLVKYSFIPQKKPILFRRAVELSLAMYKGSVLEVDARSEAGFRVSEVYLALRSKVYYNVNFIYSQILVDIELMNLSPTIARRVAIRVSVLARSVLRLCEIKTYTQLP